MSDMKLILFALASLVTALAILPLGANAHDPILVDQYTIKREKQHHQDYTRPREPVYSQQQHPPASDNTIGVF